MAKKTSKNNEEAGVLSSQSQLNSFLKNNKEHHYNFQKDIYYKIYKNGTFL